MNFKFAVGQAVECTPRGGKVGLYRVIRQIPEEHQALDRKYRIQSPQGMERSAFEFDLTAYAEGGDPYPIPVPSAARY